MSHQTMTCYTLRYRATPGAVIPNPHVGISDVVEQTVQKLSNRTMITFRKYFIVSEMFWEVLWLLKELQEFQ